MTFEDIFSRYVTATALGEAIGRNPVRAAEMRQRGSIAAKYWPRLVADAKERGFDDITLEALVEAHAAAAKASRKSGAAA